MNVKSRSLLKNISFFAIGAFLPKLISFILVPIYTGYLSTAEYGIADLISTTVQLAMPIFTLTIYDAVLRFSLDKMYNKSMVFSVGMKITGFGIILVSIAIFLCTKILCIIEPIYGVFFILTYIVSSISNVFSVFLRSIDKVKVVVLSGIVNSVIMLVANIVFLTYLHFGLLGYLWAHILGSITALLICFFGGKLFKYLTIKIDKHVQKEMILFSFPMIFSALAWWVNGASDKYILSLFYGSAVVGVYSVAGKIPAILAIFQSVFSQAWSISAVTEFDRNDEDGFIGNIHMMNNFCLFFVGSILICVNIPLSRMLYSNDFFEAWKYVPPLIVAGVFNSLALFTGSLFMAVKDTKSRMVATIIGAALNLALNLVLIPYWGAYAAALSTVLGFISSYVYQEYKIKKHIAIKSDSLKNYVAAVLLVIQMVISFWGNKLIILQLLIMCIIFVMYFKYLKLIVCKIRTKLGTIAK